jgi:hypothetical protein
MDGLEQFSLQWLQKQLREILAADQDFSPNLPLADLPGKPKMRWLYAELRRYGVNLPPLFLSRKQHVVIARIAVFCALLFAADALRRPMAWDHISGAVVLSLAVWAVLAILAKSFLARISSADTVGELARQLFAEHPLFFSRLSGQSLSRAQVREIVTRVLIDTRGVDRSEVTPDARLADILK